MVCLGSIIVIFAFLRFLVSLFLSKIEYNTGKTNMVNNVAETNPPITTVANGLCTSAPAFVEIAIGKNPSAAAAAVNITGRRRSLAPLIILIRMFLQRRILPVKSHGLQITTLDLMKISNRLKM